MTRLASRTALLLLVVAGPSVAHAQVPSGIAAVDSASAARAAYQRAVRASDLATARAEMARASAAWPAQQSYVWGRAMLAARAGDTAATLEALAAYADLSLGRTLGGVAELKPLLALPAFKQVEARHAANRAPYAQSRVVATLTDSTTWPEGMDYDPRTGDYYIASIQHGTIMRRTPDGVVTPLWQRDAARTGAMLAVRVDTARNVLWATTSGMTADSSIAALLRIRLPDGVIERRWDLPVVPRGHILGDVAIGPRGDVYFSDSNQPVVYRLRPGADTLESTRSPLFNSAQGLAPTPDGRALYIADYSHGLIRMDLATGALHRLPDAPHSTSLGVDGIVWYRGSIVAIQNGVSPARVVRFHLDGAGTSIARVELVDRNTAVADEPTIGTMVGDEFVYVANSQWDKRDAAGKPQPGVRLSAPVLLGVKLR